MANILSVDKQIAVIGALAEGSITSARDAVRAAIVQEFRARESAEEA